jgi:phosphoribosylaminoimidazole (AIR) synthetase
MMKVRKWRGMSAREAYRVFNVGNGALVVLDEKDVDDFIWSAKNYGLQAQRSGTIIKSTQTPSLTVTSKFNGGTLVYEMGEED